jgi:hypothetical protein
VPWPAAEMEIAMRILRSALLLSSLAAGALLAGGPASALPLSPAAAGAERAAQTDPFQAVIPASRSGRRLTAGIIGGLLLGGIVASHWPYRYGYYPQYGYAPYAPYAPYPLYAPGYSGDAAIAYCIRRFKSYDVHSRTYLGFDGRRHYCP